VFKLSPIQFSCTTLQYTFDESMLKFYEMFARKVGLEVIKRKNQMLIMGDCLTLPIEPFFPGEYIVSYHDLEGGIIFCGDDDIDALRHMFLIKDVDANVSMNFINPLPRILSRYLFEIPGYETKWIFALITRTCNLNCEFCYERRREEFVDATKLVEAIERIVESWRKEKEKERFFVMKQKYGVTIGGGEPTIHPKFEEIVRSIRDKVDTLTISTNGTNVEKILKVAEFIDGTAVSAPFIYDDELMKKLYPLSKERIESAVVQLLDKITNVCLTIIVTSKMREDHIENLIDYAKNCGVKYLLFTLFKPFFNGRKFIDLLPDLWKAREFLVKIAKLSKEEKDVKLLVDACFVTYTTYTICPSRNGVLLTPNLFMTRICPYRESSYDCPFIALYRSQIYETLSKEMSGRATK